jgi:putative DNA primase/helicase
MIQAKDYYDLGWQVIPQEWGTVKPLIKVSDYFFQKYYDKGWFSSKTNIAIVCGEVSNIIVLDIDNIEHKFMEEIKPYMKGLNTPQSKSNKGYHIFFRYDPAFEKKEQYKENGVNIFDVQTNKTLITLPPSLHKNGTTIYKWIRDPFTTPVADMPKEIKEIIKGYTTKQLIAKQKNNNRNDLHIGRLKDLSIVDVAERLGIDIDRNSKANCFLPTHQDQHRSLSFDIEKNYYHCFGCNDNSGDTIKLVQKYYDCGFIEACTWLTKEFFYMEQKKYTNNPEKVLMDLDSLIEYLIKTGKPVDLIKEYVYLGGKLTEGKIPAKYKGHLIIQLLVKHIHEQGYQICKTDQEMIYIYNGACWLHLSIDLARYLFKNIALSFGIDLFEAYDSYTLDKLMKQFLDTGFKQINKLGKVMINLKNCIIQIVDGHIEQLDFDPDKFFTYQLEYNYDPDAKCPLFEKFLNRVLPDKDDQKTAQEFLGYCFTRNSYLKLDKSLFLYGEGFNGKSVFYEIVRGLIGCQNMSDFSMTDLEQEHYRALLADKIVNFSSEFGKMQDKEIFKKLAAGETISARHKYGHPFLVTDYCRFIFNTNSLPMVVEHSYAFFRRFLVLHFDQTIPINEQDVNLANKIISTELSGIFNWIVEGLNRLMLNKSFTESKKSWNLMQKYKMETDNVHIFTLSEYFNEEIVEISGVDLYSKYKDFCIENGYQKLGRNNFYERFVKVTDYVIETRHKTKYFMKEDPIKKELDAI